ncbi:MAG: hypothetical protein ACAI34_14260 [Verrucomicrobium sp.]|nr:hypothetical protein [Verrucomicrobium sp.]
MRGFPPLHFLLFALAFAIFAVPLSRLTFARTQVNAPAEEERELTATDPRPTYVRLRFAHVPTKVSVTMGEQTIIGGDRAVGKTSTEVQVPLVVPKEGVELIVSATWPEGTPDTAVTVEVEPDAMETKSVTVWSNGTNLDGHVCSFTW